MSFTVLSPGPQALFQDRGRFGFAGSGVGSSGAFDRLSAARANHVLGNDPNATVIEIPLCLVQMGTCNAGPLAHATGIVSGMLLFTPTARSSR